MAMQDFLDETFVAAKLKLPQLANSNSYITADVHIVTNQKDGACLSAEGQLVYRPSFSVGTVINPAKFHTSPSNPLSTFSNVPPTQHYERTGAIAFFSTGLEIEISNFDSQQGVNVKITQGGHPVNFQAQCLAEVLYGTDQPNNPANTVCLVSLNNVQVWN